ncbi:MAG: sigma-54 dependent transcriptional regulator [Polyangiaceae bacterium]
MPDPTPVLEGEPPVPSVRSTRPKIAIVDDHPQILKAFRVLLEREGFAVDTFELAATIAAKPPAEYREYAAVCLDLGLGETNGIDVLRHLRAKSQDVPVIIVTGDTMLDTAITAMRAGAYDYVTKPVVDNRLTLTVNKAIEHSQLVRRLHDLTEQLDESNSQRALVGQSAVMASLTQSIQRVHNSDVAVCILGESGTGKELVARAIHYEGRRRKGPFVAINCASIPENLQESELFGHERGAFTGALTTQKGRFEQAEGGTLFLDEIGDTTPATQVKLLRALQEKSIRRVGGTTDIKTDARVITATHRDLEGMVRRGEFREDLYFRLMVFPIEVPPLRDRRGDIPLLVAHFLKRYRDDVGRPVNRLSPDALEALMTHDWPGNVRELENIVHRAMLTSTSDCIELADLPASLRNPVLPTLPESKAPPSGSATPESGLPTLNLHNLESLAIQAALKETQGHIANAAKLLGLGRATLYRRLVDIGLKVDVKKE